MKITWWDCFLNCLIVDESEAHCYDTDSITDIISTSVNYSELEVCLVLVWDLPEGPQKDPWRSQDPTLRTTAADPNDVAFHYQTTLLAKIISPQIRAQAVTYTQYSPLND